MTRTTVGMRVEDLYCYGFKPDEMLAPDERQDIEQWAKGFEECSYRLDELQAMTDQELVAAAYGAMAEYARGQV